MSLMKKMFRVLLVTGLMAAPGLASSQDDAAADIKARLAPVGSTCMSGDECAAAPVAVVSGPKSGKDVYAGFCTTCHGAGVMGAPKSGSAADWAPRIAKGMDTLYTHALHGFNAMPAKGLCNACSDDEVKSAVDYMVEAAK